MPWKTTNRNNFGSQRFAEGSKSSTFRAPIIQIFQEIQKGNGGGGGDGFRMFPCSNITSPQGARKDAEFQSRLRVMDIDEATAGRRETPWDLLALEGEKLENLGQTIALTSIRRSRAYSTCYPFGSISLFGILAFVTFQFCTEEKLLRKRSSLKWGNLKYPQISQNWSHAWLNKTVKTLFLEFLAEFWCQFGSSFRAPIPEDIHPFAPDGFGPTLWYDRRLDGLRTQWMSNNSSIVWASGREGDMRERLHTLYINQYKVRIITFKKKANHP